MTETVEVPPIGDVNGSGIDVIASAAQYSMVNATWPKQGKVILASFDESRIVVYQAFNAEIAAWAVKNQRFGGPHFKDDRMTWIKTNFLWMMYRAGWGTKDSNQSNILAITIKRSAFEAILSQSWATSYGECNTKAYATHEQWKQAKPAKGTGVRLQWDPDHDPHGNKVERRAVQLGMSPSVVKELWNTPSCIVHIADITAFVAEQRDRLFAGEPTFKVPYERPYIFVDSEVSENVGAIS